jgi:hypothetical protein
MTFVLFALGITAAFFAGSLALLNLGRHLGLRYLRKQGAGSMAGLSTIEGAVFALIGLLVAFTVSGALTRYDERRQLVVQEASAVATAYDRLGLFETEVASGLRDRLRDYVRARIDLYRMPHDFSVWEDAEVWPREQQEKIAALKSGLWDAVVAACPQSDFRPACGFSMTALGNAFDVARLRTGAAEKHPPQIIYILLYGLGLGGSLLAGFGMAAAKTRSWIHMVVFAATLAVTLYVITDMEYPRLGLIRIEGFDHFLTDAYDQMR